MLRKQPFYGQPAMKLAIVEDPNEETASVDGTTMRFGPAFIDGKEDRYLMTVIAHEVLHCAHKHMFRFGHRDHAAWNVACDYSINLILKDAGFPMPPDALIDEQYREPGTGHPLPPEVIYARFPPNDRPGPRPGDSKFVPPPEKPQDATEPEPLTGPDWDRIMIASQNTADRVGKGGGGAARSVAESRSPRPDWRPEVEEFLEQVQPSDWTWTEPNRRYLPLGLYLPGILKESFPHFGMIVDTSGSVDPPTLNVVGKMISDFNRTVEPEAITVVYCDAQVQGTETFGPGDTVTLHAKGGGGTNMQPAFDVFNAMPEPPACVICITDAYFSPGLKRPSYPVLFALTPGTSRKAGPFGRSVRVDPNE
jgi:predicted metal-dependent peptidase